jgi:hypothetical protein
MTTAATTPRDFTVLLPPGWARLPLDGSETAQAAALAAAAVSALPQPQREQARLGLLRMLRATLRDARAAGGIDVLLSLAERDGIPLAASCLVTYLDDDGARMPLPGLAAVLAARGGAVEAAEIARGPAVRHRHSGGRVTRLDYYLPVPGRPGLLALSFATPVEPLADALVVLFDAITESLRWRS